MSLERTMPLMRGITAALLLGVSLPAVAQTEDDRVWQEPVYEPSEQPQWWRTFDTDLTRLGLKQGVVLEGTNDASDLFFPVPQGVEMRSAVLELQVEFAESLNPLSSLTVAVNGTPRRSLTRSAADQAGRLALQLPLNAADLKKEYTHVRVDVSLLQDTDRCVNNQLRGAFARILPESGVQYALTETPPASIEAAWDLLPDEVTLGLDTANLDAGQFTAALAIATELDRGGHTVKITDLKQMSSIVIASPKRFAAALDWSGLRRVDGQSWSPEDTADLELLLASSLGGQPVIWVPAANAAEAASLLAGPWRKMARGVQISVDRAEPWRNADAAEAVTFAELGLVDSARDVTDRTTWRVTLEQDNLGPGRVPDGLELLLVSAPSQTASNVLAHVYFNDRLLRSSPLDNRGGIQRLSVDLPANLRRARNRVEVAVQRRTEGGDCRLDAPAFPVQLLPESQVVTGEAGGSIESFAEFIPHAPTAALYLPESVLQRPQQVMPFLLALGRSLWPRGALPAVAFYGAEEDVSPTGAFVVVGDPVNKPRGLVAFDRGGIQVRASRSNQVVLDVASLPGWNILQLADWQGQRGLWLKTRENFEGLPATEMFLEDENVAILNHKGVAFALRSSPRAAVKIAYTGKSRWQAWLGKYRLAIFVTLWILLVVLIAYLLRMSRRHSRGGSR